MDAVKNALGSKADQSGAPGNGVEGAADNAVNTQVDNAATSAGVPKEADRFINDAVDKKVNEEIPGGN